MEEANNHDNDNCDDEDDDLQAALALSMCDADADADADAEAVVTKDSNRHDEIMERPSPPPPLQSLPHNGKSILNVNEKGTQEEIIMARLQNNKKNADHFKIFDCQSFQKLMWDDKSTTATTTMDDKLRWIGECFQLRGHHLQSSWVDGEKKSSYQVAASADAADAATTAATTAADHNDEMLAVKNMSSCNYGNNMSSLQTALEIFTGFKISEHKPPLPHHLPQPIWGLTQTHGGPCGVLAAVQAEMIRILLFGRRRVDTVEEHGCGVVVGGCYNENQLGGSGRGGGERSQRQQLSNTLFYPFEVSPSSSSTSCVSPPITEREVTDSMAMAIGMILARAALGPCTTTASSCLNESSSSSMIMDSPLHKNNRPTVQIVLPRVACQNHHPTSTQGGGETLSPRPTLTSTTSWLQELLCTPPIAQSADHDCLIGSQSINTSSQYLIVHTIGVSEAAVTNDNSRDHGVPLATSRQIDNDNENYDPKLPEMKRHRSSSCTKINIRNQGGEMGLNDNIHGKLIHSAASSSLPSCEQVKLTALATAVANFLIRESGLVSSMENELERIDQHADCCTPSTGNDSTSSSSSSPLDFFQKPGGVMFLVMSLVATRGIDRIRADMDDPNTSLTSNFGHSSQELMNLLLTGRAVSNVFDNSMVLSDELICHGIQSRSAVGYLSILESLRYCEVGGYYKSPSLPIWIVGSTSHFTVLFGDEQCLIESKSDLLLEKCRRAFQKVEGGNGDNGFIPVDKLGDVLDELDLTSKVGDNGVQTLKAYLEVSGAGIILWDDFWKACSRLMTGSSLEVIMSGQDHLMRDANDDFNLDMVRASMSWDMKDFENSDFWASLNPDLRPRGYLNEKHIDQYDESNNKMPAVAPAPASQSDEELARRLAAEWEDNNKKIHSIEEQALTVWKTPSDRDLFMQHGNQEDETNGKMPAAATSQSDEEMARRCESDYSIVQNITAKWNPELGIMKTPSDTNRNLLMQHVNRDDEMNHKMPAAAASRSDEELARRLAAEWGSLPDQEEEAVDFGMKSDEDYARKLQAMWDAEVTTGHATSSAIDVSSHVATTDDDVASLASDGSPIGAYLLEGAIMDGDSMQNTKKPAIEKIISTATKTNDETTGDQSQHDVKRPHVDFERHGLSFPLFHYNGLRGGKITCFRVQKLSPTEAVGASISSSSKGGGGHGSGARGCDLEDVVRTKWPSSLVNWFGEDPPSID